jgi:hypothetical protein
MSKGLMLWMAAMSLLLSTACGSSEGVKDGGAPDGSAVVDGGSDAGADAGAGLPTTLNVKYTRNDPGVPVTDDEVKAFTLKVMGFFKKVRYFDYVLYTTHGVDASTGMRDWQFWYNEHFRKEGDKVVFYHPTNPNDGGHNLHIPMSRVLGDVLAAYLLIGDQTAGLAAEKLCKGMTASMLGMVHDKDDTLMHLMTRNIAVFAHDFLTHDGKRKGVDYSGWYYPNERWNTCRFEYTQNPYWGKVWVTNMRSKDDVPHIFRLVPVLRYAAEGAQAANVKEACGEALGLLELFAKDIVESDYRIRTKDKDGKVMIFGFTDDPELNQKQGDLASFIHYREIVPEGECNARRGAELIGYHRQVKENCGRGEPNAYDEISFSINSYNNRICRYFHLAHVANSLVNRDDKASAKLLDGLAERMEKEKAVPPEKMQTTEDQWWMDVALYLAQSHSFGLPLLSDEVRLVHKYYGRAADELAAWPYWDPWAASVPQGELGGYRPGSCKGSGDQQTCWFRVEDMAQIFENCWSPFVNQSGAKLVDCDIVRDPAKW